MTMPAAPRPKPPSAADVKASYGFVALLCQTVPELRKILDQAIKSSWTADRFTQTVANSHWWKTEADTDRQWLMERITDPATAKRDLQAGEAQIRAELAKLGMDADNPGSGRIQQLWLQSRLQKLSGDSLDGWLAGQFKMDDASWSSENGAPGGQYGKLISDGYDLAYAYGYAPPDLQQQILKYAYDGLKSGSPDAATQGFENRMRQYASTKYSAFAEQIKGGATVKDIAQPYIDTWSQTLELDPSTVKLSDQNVQKWLQGTPAPDGKAATPPTVWQVQQQARQDPRWGQTRNAWQAASQVAQQIGKTFGFVG
jgi:hypothetical protein